MFLFCGFSPSQASGAGSTLRKRQQPRSHRRGCLGPCPLPLCPRASSSPTASRRGRGFVVVVAGLRFGLKALEHSHVLPEVESAATSPLQTNKKPLPDQKGPVIRRRPYVHPAGSKGMLGADVLAAFFFPVGPQQFWSSGVRLNFTPVLPCLAARPAGPGRGRPPTAPGLPAPRLRCPRVV